MFYKFLYNNRSLFLNSQWEYKNPLTQVDIKLYTPPPPPPPPLQFSHLYHTKQNSENTKKIIIKKK